VLTAPHPAPRRHLPHHPMLPHHSVLPRHSALPHHRPVRTHRPRCGPGRWIHRRGRGHWRRCLGLRCWRHRDGRRRRHGLALGLWHSGSRGSHGRCRGRRRALGQRRRGNRQRREHCGAVQEMLHASVLCGSPGE
jgi:hypothetical protein